VELGVAPRTAPIGVWVNYKEKGGEPEKDKKRHEFRKEARSHLVNGDLQESMLEESPNFG